MNQNRRTHITQKTIAISCIVPCYNEQENIAPFIKALRHTLQEFSNTFEIIVVNDGSNDNTVKHILQTAADTPEIKMLSFSRNFGKEVAITAGLAHSTGTVAIIIDADFQHPMPMIGQFLSHWAQGYDMVYAVQTKRTHQSLIVRSFTRLFYTLLQKTTIVNIPPNAGDFRLLDQKVVTALKQCSERNRFMKGLYAWVGFKSVGIPYTPNKRKEGKSTWEFSQLTELAITGLTAFSSVPLRIWGLVGFAISLLALAYAICIVFNTLLFGVDVPGFATLITAIMLFGGIQLLSIGILGEYISRIFDEVKQRPQYIIDQTLGFPAKPPVPPTDDKS